MTFSVLGTDENGNRIQVSQSARRDGMYIIGATGTGKSTLIQSLVLQDISQGLGVALLDPHGDLTNRILESMTERLDDVILLDVANDGFPFGLNLFFCPYPNDIRWVQYTVNQVMHIFNRLYNINRETPDMSYFLRNCTHTIIANQGYTMAEIPLLLTNGAFRKRMVANVNNSQVLLFWSEYENIIRSKYEYGRTVRPILNKLDEFLQPMLRNIVGQSKSTIDLRTIMDNRKLLFVKLDPRLEDMTTLIGSTIVSLVLNAAYSRGELLEKKRRQLNLYCDEFEFFAGEDFMQLVSEARKFGIGTTVSNQTLSQIQEDVKENILQAATLVVFRVSGQDGEELATEFDAVPPPAETRRESVLVPKQNVLDHLLNHGHLNADVTKFVTEYLTYLKYIETDRPNSSIYTSVMYITYDETDRYEYDTINISTLMHSMNILMYKKMMQERGMWGAVERRIGDVASIFGYENYYDTQINPKTPQTQNAFQMYQQASQAKSNLFTGGREPDEREFILMSEKKKAAEKNLCEVGIAFIATKYRVNEIQARERFQREERRYQDFWTSFTFMLDALESEPILTESGKYEDKPLAPRTIADVEKEVAKFLSSPLKLPNLTAYVKTPTGEQKITIDHAHRGISRSELQRRIANILGRNYDDGYLPKRSEVEREIHERSMPPEPTQTQPNLRKPTHAEPAVIDVEDTPSPPPQAPPIPQSRKRK